MKAYAGSLFSGNVGEQQGGVVCAMELSGEWIENVVSWLKILGTTFQQCE
jgi:hypothetical protein